MENWTFDQIVGRLGADASRRRILGGLIGTVTAALAGRTTRAAGSHHASRKRRRRTDTGGRGAGTDKVVICHFTSNPRSVERIRVGGRALRAHLAHGDVRFVDCCVNDDCEVGACFSAQCVNGTCGQTQLPAGTPCDLEGPAGGAGGCTPGGQCVPAGGAGG